MTEETKLISQLPSDDVINSDDVFEKETAAGQSRHITGATLLSLGSVEELTTAETDTTKHLVPDGDGGVQFVTPPAAGDADAIHDNVSGEINAITEKTILGRWDKFITENADGTYEKNSASLDNILSSIARGGANWFFYLDDTTSDLGGGIKTLTDKYIVDAHADTESLTVGDDQLIFQFATISGQPNTAFWHEGVWYIRAGFSLLTLSRTCEVYAKLYAKNEYGETLLGTSPVGNQDFNNDTTLGGNAFSYSGYSFPIQSLYPPVLLNNTDRLVIKFYANVSGSGSDGTIRIWMDNTSGMWAKIDTQMLHHIFSRLDHTHTSLVDDTAYGSGWNGDTTKAPSKNAVYDKIESLGSNSGAILAVVKQYDGWIEITPTSSWADVDATNLKIDIVVPSSGKILLCLYGYAHVNGSTIAWGIRESTTMIAGHRVLETSYANNLLASIEAKFYISGLTPGSSHTYKWAHKFTSGSNGSTRGSPASSMDDYGPVILSAYYL